MGLDDTWTGPAREGCPADIYIRWRIEGLDGLAIGDIGWCKDPYTTPSTLRYAAKGDTHFHAPKWTESWFPDAFAGSMGQLLIALEAGTPPAISGRDNLKKHGPGRRGLPQRHGAPRRHDRRNRERNERMKLGIINSAFGQSGMDTATGLKHIARIGFDTVDISTEAVGISKKEVEPRSQRLPPGTGLPIVSLARSRRGTH